MLSINLKRSVGALAVTAGFLAAGAPASHAYNLETVMISGSFSGAAQPGSTAFVLENAMISNLKAKTTNGSGAKVQVQDVHFSTKAKGAKGKHGKGKPTHTYDVQSSNHA